MGVWVGFWVGLVRVWGWLGLAVFLVFAVVVVVAVLVVVVLVVRVAGLVVVFRVV